jgi:hypothetical protein
LLSWKALLLWCRSWSGDTGGDTELPNFFYISASKPSTLSTFFPIQTTLLRTHTCWYIHVNTFLKCISRPHPIQATITSLYQVSKITTNSRDASVYLEQYQNTSQLLIRYVSSLSLHDTTCLRLDAFMCRWSASSQSQRRVAFLTKH